MPQQAPNDWKNYEDFATGIATNRLPSTDRLAGKTLSYTLKNRQKWKLVFSSARKVSWTCGRDRGAGACDVVEVAPQTWLVDMTFGDRPKDALTVVVNSKTRRVLSVYQHVREEGEAPGEPRVAQNWQPGVLGSGKATGSEPGPTRDLIGLRAFYRYSPNHLYEHTYLSSTRYCWQNLIGEQRGHGDVDMATTYKFADNQYVFGFREFIIPVASTFFFNFDDMRSTGKFLGVRGDGAVENSPAGALIEKASMTFYNKGEEPV